MKKTGMKSETNRTSFDWNTPVYNALKSYSASGTIPFHMPGHKLGSGIPGIFLSEIEKLDLTEIPGTDDLHRPEGVLKEAQELAASAFGAKTSRFVVNGSTGGLHAAIAAACRPGQRLITCRDCHGSVVNGMLMAGVSPYYILPGYSDEFRISTGITPDDVEKALADAPDAPAVLITRPSYYGLCCDIRKIAHIVHNHGRVLIVDEAHGPHFTFNKRLPASALEAGADICVQSAHKTLPAFTQGAYLHIGSDRVDPERVDYFLNIYQTTSPSFIIMAFLDMAREIMQKQGKELLDRLLGSIQANRGRLDGSALRLLDGTAVPGFDHDPTRITVNVSRLGMTGYEAEKLLRNRYSIQAEMSDLSNVVFISTAADSPGSIGRLFDALIDLQRRPCAGAGEACCAKGRDRTQGLPDLGQTYTALLKRQIESARNGRSGCRDIMSADAERVKLEDAAGRISKCVISPYPPGTALICPGEVITREAVEFITDVAGAGGKVHGIDKDGTVLVLCRK
ncbi:MAG: aminotransferase class I/II-fold pyridoxal phosphate-dependent enzyme [Clostridiaceae bacterium]|jgi:arginine/lysine/ornithine decarboxylase|nr:aminotransferase class I/II-fold pyridoxal phosphate-dependent enzyme [Clostridiaceae bacterium]